MRITRQDAHRLGLDFDALWRLFAPSQDRPEVILLGEPRIIAAEAAEGWWEVVFLDWAPASKNLKCKGVRNWHRARQRDNAAIALWCDLPISPGIATNPRRVMCRCERKRCGGRLPDAINLVESLADSLVANRLLVDDSMKWLERCDVMVGVNREIEGAWRTTIRLDDV